MLGTVFITAIFYFLIPKTNTHFDYFILGYMIIPFLLIMREQKSLLSKSFILFKILSFFILISGVKDFLFFKFNIEVSLIQESIIDLSLLTIILNPIKLYQVIFQFFDFIKISLKELKRKKLNLLSLDEIDRMDDGVADKGKGFELYIAQVFRKGKFKAYTTDELKEKKDMPESIMKRGGRGEQGCDNIIWFKKKIKIHGKVCDGFLVQAKRYKGSVENKAAQEAYGAIPMYEKHFNKNLYPIVVTNSKLSAEGYDLAESQNTLVVDRNNIIEFFNEGANGNILKIW